jgi:3-hydroxybutyryl-CoA dehydrogenase
MRTISAVGIVGSGTMGRGIAESALRAGVQVILHDSSHDALSAARKHIEANLQRSVDKGQLSAQLASDHLASLGTATELGAFSDCQLVIEAVPEILEVKTAVLASVEEHVAGTAIIASNTSSIPITRLAQAVTNPDRFLGLHFFNPVPRMPLVEVIRTLHSSDGTVAEARQFVEDGLGKTAVLIEDRPGFVVNALLVPFLLAAARMLDSGYASAETIDHGMKLGCGHPMGPLQLADFIGLDVVCAAADAMFKESHDPALVVPNNLRRLVDAGHLGAKTGRGFYSDTRGS